MHCVSNYCCNNFKNPADMPHKTLWLHYQYCTQIWNSNGPGSHWWLMFCKRDLMYLWQSSLYHTAYILPPLGDVRIVLVKGWREWQQQRLEEVWQRAEALSVKNHNAVLFLISPVHLETHALKLIAPQHFTFASHDILFIRFIKSTLTDAGPQTAYCIFMFCASHQLQPFEDSLIVSPLTVTSFESCSTVLPEATWTVTLFFPSLRNACEMLPSKVIMGWISEEKTEN